MMTSEVSKLAELRAKTDRELVVVLDNALELGIQCASADRNAGPLSHRAERIYADVLMLLPKVESVALRQRLEIKLERLRDSLWGRAKTQTASSSAC